MVDTIAEPRRPPAPRGALPGGIVLSRYWREAIDGPLVKHDHDRPIDESTDLPVGVWWMCPDDCTTGEWVFPDRETGEPGSPKKQFCASHGERLLPGRSDPTAQDPKADARSWLQQRLADRAAAIRQQAADAARIRLTAIRAAGRDEATRVVDDMREHVPSAAISAGALVGDFALLSQLDSIQVYALGAGLAIGGTVLAYLAVYAGEVVYARRMGYTLRELPRAHRDRARSHARWVASGVLASGVWLLIAETIGADISNMRGVLMSLLGAVMIGVVNYQPWARMVARRKAEARARLEAAERAARAEEERLAAEAEAERRRQQEEEDALRAEEEAKRAAEEAALAEARRIVATEDDRLTAGQKFAERWERIATDAKARNNGPGFEIWRTNVVAEETRKLTAKIPEGETVIGWEFLVRAEPGVLAPRTNSDQSPFVMMRRWLASMLEVEVTMLDLAYQPERLTDGSDSNGQAQPLINHGLITLSETFPLGEPVPHPGASGAYIDAKGTRWGYAGRDLRGRDVYRRHWTPGQAGGAGRYGVTGTGKSVVTQSTAIGDLHLGILPIIHDAGKSAMDFVDFYGIFPVGHTIEHRDIIRESLWAEMKRRQAWTNMRTTKGLGGMEVTADPTWDPIAGGPPIRVTWEEFHMHMKDPKFVQMLGEMIRLQRSTAIMAEPATQGTGLTDMGDNNLREQLNEICMQLMRMTDHTARLAGYRGEYKTSDLPRLPGMMIMVDGQSAPIPYRSAYIPRDPQNPESLIYHLRRPNGTPEGEQILFAPELPPETVEVFEQHGLMDLWEMGKTKSGRERLQSEADPVASDVFPGAALTAALGGAAASATKPRMRADDVILALLKHDADTGGQGVTQPEILASTWWKSVDGEWSKNANGVPVHTTISRACNRLAGDTAGGPLVEADSNVSPARWSLLPAGTVRGEQMLTLIRSAGALGAKAQTQAHANGVDVAALERQAMLEAEQAALIQELIREAASQLTGAQD